MDVERFWGSAKGLSKGDGAVIKIRPAMPVDAKAIRACAEEAYAGYMTAIGRKPAPMVADFEALISQGHVHLAGHTGKLQGFIVFFQMDGAMLLENVAVAASARGQGVGRALVQFCEKRAEAEGLSAIRLYTNVKMTSNLTLYPHLGYREVGRREEDGFQRVYFEKRLRDRKENRSQSR
jgi:ribosomal protein S18 acetylase RimI-like enzyme